jgi:hypothetical protein
VAGIDGRNGIAVSGPSPAFIFNDSGLPGVLPLSFPEVPYVNNGAFLVCSFSCGYVSGLATLWSEHDDGNDSTRANKQSTLELFQETAGCYSQPGSLLSGKSVTVGRTVHASAEFVKRGDDRTEQELLERKTFVLSCSEELVKPFTQLVFAKAELEADLLLKDRYIPSMDSFSEPDLDLGPAPPLRTRQHSLVLTQGGEAVAVHNLAEREYVLGMEVVSLIVEKAVPQMGMSKARPARRRVFVLASTVIEQEHGEDTLGEGRLLLFAIDYAYFQEEGAGQDDNGKEKEKAEGPQAGAGRNTAEQLAAQSAFFGAIQPKLKQIWAGPGPASTVKQLGEYLVTTVGCHVYVYKLLPETLELEQVAFYYATFYISSVSVMKDYIMLCDAHKSVTFLSWKEDDFALIPLGKDYNDCFGLSTGFVSDASQLGMLLGDDEGNVQLLQYAPK